MKLLTTGIVKSYAFLFKNTNAGLSLATTAVSPSILAINVANFCSRHQVTTISEPVGRDIS